jgi:DNA-directed RNA polymerase specialized sigma24 family protein
MSVTETFQLTKNNFRFSGTRSSHQDEITEEGMIDFLAAQNSDSNTMQSRIHLTFDELVSLVDSDDKRILKYAFIDNMKGEDLAAALRVSIGAANVRLSRAISRLRKAYLSSESSERNE